MDYRGNHVTLDIKLKHDIPANIVDIVSAGLKQSGLTVVDGIVKQFDPIGITAVWILSESHATLHTYPEHNYLSIDIYTCGENGTPELALHAILANLGVSYGYKIMKIERGV